MGTAVKTGHCETCQRKTPRLLLKSVHPVAKCMCSHPYHKGEPCPNKPDPSTDACLPCVFGCPTGDDDG